MRLNEFRVYCEIEFEGRITKCMGSPASWFLMTQTGKLWTYGPGEIPRPLEKEYKKAIPLFYTGLKDRNGTEIYKGDILEIDDDWESGEGERGEVMWDGKNAMFRLFCYTKYGGKGWFMPENKTWMKLKIIGNIYENPDLLKTK